MKLLLTLVMAAGVAIGGPATAAAQTIPTVELTAICSGTADTPDFNARVSGLPPGAQFIGGYDADTSPDGSGYGASTTFTASAEGTYETQLSFSERLERLTIYVIYEGIRTEDSIERPCQLPTTKTECHDSGWRSFGVFKNEGDCVSFVATGTRNPPANTTP